MRYVEKFADPASYQALSYEDTPDFVPVPLSRPRPGIGCVSQINETLWEGRYSPKWPDGVKRPRNVYAHSREECEEKLEKLILETKGEMAALCSGASTEYPEDGNSKKNTITAYYGNIRV